MFREARGKEERGQTCVSAVSVIIPQRQARRLRVEVEGGLYHLITRGNDRQDIFHTEDDRRKFLSLLARQKERSPFHLYAYCLMTNHAHLLMYKSVPYINW